MKTKQIDSISTSHRDRKTYDYDVTSSGYHESLGKRTDTTHDLNSHNAQATMHYSLDLLQLFATPFVN